MPKPKSSSPNHPKNIDRFIDILSDSYKIILSATILSITLISTTYLGYSSTQPKTLKNPPPPTVPPVDTNPSPTPSPTPSPPNTLSLPTPIPTTNPTTSPSPPIISTPTPTPLPPVIRITYPTDGQHIEMNDTQTLLVGDVPDGTGDNTGLQKRHNFNGAGWSDYQPFTILTLDPVEDDNVIQLQYKNVHNRETPIYTIHFTFHRIK